MSKMRMRIRLAGILLILVGLVGQLIPNWASLGFLLLLGLPLVVISFVLEDKSTTELFDRGYCDIYQAISYRNSSVTISDDEAEIKNLPYAIEEYLNTLTKEQLIRFSVSAYAAPTNTITLLERFYVECALACKDKVCRLEEQARIERAIVIIPLFPVDSFFCSYIEAQALLLNMRTVDYKQMARETLPFVRATYMIALKANPLCGYVWAQIARTYMWSAFEDLTSAAYAIKKAKVISPNDRLVLKVEKEILQDERVSKVISAEDSKLSRNMRDQGDIHQIRTWTE